jgi:N-acetylglucosaminyldiphosphoundecaprenol N-acetyl-beta-D-mannosaminyltransferase
MYEFINTSRIPEAAATARDRSKEAWPAENGRPLPSVDTETVGLLPERDLLGIPFATLDMPAVVQTLAVRPVSAPFAYIATPNVHHLVLLRRGGAGFAFGLSRAWFLTCDSRVLRGFGRLLFGKSLPLVTGSDLTVHLLNSVIEPDDAITVIGGDERLRRDLADRFGLNNIALYSPPFGFGGNEAELRRCIDFVQDHPARFVFVACGAPQSEVLAGRIREAGGSTGIGLCIGASLLFATGRIKRAPLAWQHLGLEWLYRLTQERRRLGRRLWQTQLPVFGIAARAWLSGNPDSAHRSHLDRPGLGT